MSRKLYIADMHIGHENCLAFDRRPFATIEEHDEALIKNWNEVVGVDDHVYVIGDFIFRFVHPASYYMQKLHGHIHLIRGNHDKRTKVYESCFESVSDIQTVKDRLHGEPVEVVLCHYWIPFFPGFEDGAYMLHGHTHRGSKDQQMEESLKNRIRQSYGCYHAYNVGCMWQDYYPQTLEQIVARQGDCEETRPEADTFWLDLEAGQGLRRDEEDHAQDASKDDPMKEVLNSERHAELIAGQLVVAEMTSVRHNNAVLKIASALREHISKKNDGRRVFFQNAALYCDELTENIKGNLFLPDVMCLRNEKGIKEDGIHTAPIFVAEITSDSTRKNDYGKKMLVYEEIGVEEYWVVDLHRNTVVRYLAGEGFAPVIFPYPECRKLPLHVCPSLEIDLSHLFG